MGRLRYAGLALAVLALGAEGLGIVARTAMLVTGFALIAASLGPPGAHP